MELAEIRQKLYDAAKLRLPSFEEGMSASERVDKLEDYLLETARVRGDLEEARLYAHGALGNLKDQWNAIEGWEMQLRKGERTQAAITEAKRKCRPDTYAAIEEAKWLIDRLTEQIKRFGGTMGDDAVVSRAYTMMTAS